MTNWLLLAAYIAGWLITCRVLARYIPDSTRDGPIVLGFCALFWPALAVIALFALPVWLVTRGVGQ